MTNLINKNTGQYHPVAGVGISSRPSPANNTALMASDALRSLSPQLLLDVIEAHLEARPDIPPADLEAFSDRLRRQAWEQEREANSKIFRG